MFPKSLFKLEQSFFLLLGFFFPMPSTDKLVHLSYGILDVLDLPDCPPDVI